ncbi:serine/threonine-protein kinase/endoribonuclease IRE1-like isoform X2 [Varroa destructor]|uniref:non-specific serine/threonine protein kinase n=1 Tax=Varroa destructor TaxID=109461 RepID=A0A7M7KG98_VARDE|nr:serine/threonine-protein kinase/endoribonuclease IRE1-like isoform X2 [Varroa destructor]
MGSVVATRPMPHRQRGPFRKTGIWLRKDMALFRGTAMSFTKIALVQVLVICLCTGHVSAAEQKTATSPAATRKDVKSNVSRTQSNPILLVSMLNGELAAVDKNTGVIQWSIRENPVLKVPFSSSTSPGGAGFLPDPKDGSLYILLSQDEADHGAGSSTSGRSRTPFIKKLPFTIPELVTASPCRSSDGMLYTGQKRDVWFAIDLASGQKKETISFHGSDSVCPQGRAGLAYIGRSEYHIAMFDAATGERRWNATYYDYAATAANILEVAHAEYDLAHFASSERGRVMTFAKKTGDFLWEMDFDSPIVALYLIDDPRDTHSNLRRLPFMSLAQRTMDDIGTRILRNTWRRYLMSEWDESLLFPALYVGNVASSSQSDMTQPDAAEIYALPAMVDKSVPLIPCDGSERNVPLLEGPYNEDGSKGHRQGELFKGYYEMPDSVVSQLVPRRQISQGPTTGLLQPSSPFNQNQEGSIIEVPPRRTRDSSAQTYSTAGSQPLEHHDQAVQNISDELYWIKVALAAVVIFLIAACFHLYPQARALHQSSRSLNGFNLRISGETGQPIRELEMNENGEYTVGKINYTVQEQLGSGGNGTVVFKGCFEGRPVAVKRILPICYSLAHREVKLLRETDEHPNVVRYFCMEEDANFYYIALELCAATLAEYVENRSFDRGNPPLQPLQAIHQAASGLEHLHNLNIAHRDVKPQNLLISTATRTGQLKVMISDFGLCKKLSHDARSFSQRSGVLGTAGWIAPEVLEDDTGSRVTKAIDVFSLGCVMYYVISGGQHPFGDTLERQANIRSGKVSLAALGDSNEDLTAKGLIHQMLSMDASARPTIAQVTRHPAFWDANRTLNFFQEVSDRVEKEPHTSPVVRALEKAGIKILNSSNWIDQITTELQKDLRRFRSYKGNSIRDLLRALRNKKHHYRELPEELRAELGSIPNEYMEYFTLRFPRLLLHTYAAIQHFRHDVPLLAEYYAPDPVQNPNQTKAPAEPVEIATHPDLDSIPWPNSRGPWAASRVKNHSPTTERTARTQEQGENQPQVTTPNPNSTIDKIDTAGSGSPSDEKRVKNPQNEVTTGEVDRNFNDHDRSIILTQAGPILRDNNSQAVTQYGADEEERHKNGVEFSEKNLREALAASLAKESSPDESVSPVLEVQVAQDEASEAQPPRKNKKKKKK